MASFLGYEEVNQRDPDQARSDLEDGHGRARARYALPRGLFDYIDGGSDGEHTMRRNVEAFEELVWRPKQAIYHEQIDTATEVLGTKLAMPVMTAPCGGMRLVHPEGDIGLVKAAANFGICHIAERRLWVSRSRRSPRRTRGRSGSSSTGSGRVR